MKKHISTIIWICIVIAVMYIVCTFPRTIERDSFEVDVASNGDYPAMISANSDKCSISITDSVCDKYKKDGYYCGISEIKTDWRTAGNYHTIRCECYNINDYTIITK